MAVPGVSEARVSGRSRVRRDAVGRQAPAWLPMVLAGAVALGAALALQVVVYSGSHSGLSDLPGIITRRGIGPGALPYLDRVVEYPAGAGFLVWAATLVAPTPTGVLVVTGVVATAVCLGVGVTLYREVGGRAWRWMIGTPVLLFAFQNFDVFAIAALLAGWFAYRRRAFGWSGALVAVGAVIKLFPAAVLPVLVADRLAVGDRRGAARLVVSAAGVVALANGPLALANFHGWIWTARFQGARNATWGGIWMYVYRWLGISNRGPAAAHLANLVSLVALLVGIAALTWWTATRRVDVLAAAAASVAVLIVANKVYSPTYDVWLVLFFVLLPLSRRLWVSFCAVDLAIYVLVFGYFHGLDGRGLVHAVLPYLVIARTGVLAWFVIASLRSVPAPRWAPAAARTVDRAPSLAGAESPWEPVLPSVDRAVDVA